MASGPDVQLDLELLPLYPLEVSPRSDRRPWAGMGTLLRELFASPTQPARRTDTGVAGGNSTWTTRPPISMRTFIHYIDLPGDDIEVTVARWWSAFGGPEGVVLRDRLRIKECPSLARDGSWSARGTLGRVLPIRVRVELTPQRGRLTMMTVRPVGLGRASTGWFRRGHNVLDLLQRQLLRPVGEHVPSDRYRGRNRP